MKTFFKFIGTTLLGLAVLGLPAWLTICFLDAATIIFLSIMVLFLAWTVGSIIILIYQQRK